MPTRTIDLSRFRDLDIKSVTVRSVNGNDTLDAAGRCIPPDGKNTDHNVFILLMRQQIIAQSILSYTSADGKNVSCDGPCLDSINWSARTREFLGEIFDHMNGVSGEERESFRQSLMGLGSTPGSDDTVSAE